jgi:hypothetical protein
MRDNKAFVQAENEGRAKALVALNKTDLFKGEFDDYKVVPTNPSCKWDFEVRDNLTNELLAVVEAKDRKMLSTDRRLVVGGAQLEAPKYLLLKDMAEDREIISFYLCTFEDGTFFMWNVAECKGVTEDRRMCNKTTAVESGKVEKHCYYLPMNSAEFKGVLA